jgi:hypothetical protein
MAHATGDQPILSGVSRVSSTTRMSRTDPEEQGDPIRDDKRARRYRRRTNKLLTSLRPAVLISVSKSDHSSTCVPAVPVRTNGHPYKVHHIELGTLKLDWKVLMSPKRDYLRLVSLIHDSRKDGACRSADSVTNWYPLGLLAADIKKTGMEKALPMTTLLDDRSGQYKTKSERR